MTTPNLEQNEPKTFEDRLKGFGSKVGRSFPGIVAFLIGVWWVFSGTVDIIPSVTTISEKIGLTLSTVVLAIVFTDLLSQGGFTSAKTTHTWNKVTSDWTVAIKRGNHEKKEIMFYARELALDNQREARENNLEANGLEYKKIFNEKGELIFVDFEKNIKTKGNPNGFTRKQIKIIKKCVNIRIVIPTLFGNISSKFYGLKKEITQRQFETKNLITSIIIKTVLSVFTVGIMFKFIGFSIESFLYALFQIVLWGANGVLRRIKNYNFVVNVLQPQIVEKTLIINGYLDLNDNEKQKYKDMVNPPKGEDENE